jgi:hypothetical protein
MTCPNFDACDTDRMTCICSMRLKATLVASQACGSWPNEAQIAHAEVMLQLAHDRAIKREGVDDDQPY